VKRKVKNIPVLLGTPTLNGGRLQVPIQISRNDCSLTDADDLLCGRRLASTLFIFDGNPQAPAAELSGVCESKGFSVTPNNLTALLSFEVGLIDLNILRQFPHAQGNLRIDLSDVIAKTAPAAKEVPA
jgi:hypothetical protein